MAKHMNAAAMLIDMKYEYAGWVCAIKAAQTQSGIKVHQRKRHATIASKKAQASSSGKLE
eukprot:scaffold824_cov132-Chaetoceros_neogracile.AAC.11